MDMHYLVVGLGALSEKCATQEILAKAQLVNMHISNYRGYTDGRFWQGGQ